MIPRTPPELWDGEVRLRGWRASDVPAITRACRDPEIPRWTVVPDPYTQDDARTWLTRVEREWSDGTAAALAVEDAADGTLLGSVGLVAVHRRDARAEIGFWLAPEARGRGAMTRAVRLLARWCFEEAGLARLDLLADVENRPSQRVAERAGFVREGVLRSYLEQKGERRDFILYSLLPSDLVE